MGLGISGLARICSKGPQQLDHFAVRFGSWISEFFDGMALGDVAELYQRPDPVASTQLELAASVFKEQLEKHSVSKQPVQLHTRREDKEQYENPELHERETMP